ncbi:MAG TPA: DNA translocase FtsK, partial [Spirochaetia bacterium]|nr:DNA translocase FtsK [Spirochaetia bacterium]
MAALHGRLGPAVTSFVLVLAGLAVLSTASLVLDVCGVGGPAAALGAFLAGGFSWAGFFVPLYLAACAGMLVSPVFRQRRALLLILSIIPFLTLSLLFHVLTGSHSALVLVLVDAFGAVPSALLLFFLLALEIIFLATLPYGIRFSDDGSGRTGARLALPAIAPAAPEVEAVVVADPPWSVEEPPTLAPVVAPAPVTAAADSGEDEETRAEPPQPAEPHAEPEVAEPEPEIEEPQPEPATPAVIITPGPEQEELPFPRSASRAYTIPVHRVLKSRGDNQYWIIDEETKQASRILTDALKEFNIDAEVTGIRKGPVITLFEVLPAPGVRVSKIANLADNIALRLAAPSVRIVAPIPGRHAVGIEVPNRVRSIVSFKEMISLDVMQKSPYEIPLALGKDILGEAQ